MRAKVLGHRVAPHRVPDLADEFLQHVLEKEHAEGCLVLLDDPGEVRAGTLHGGQRVLDLVTRYAPKPALRTRLSAGTGWS